MTLNVGKESVRGPFGIRSVRVRGPLGVRSDQFRAPNSGAKKFKIETLRGAARGSYLETLPQLFSNSSLLPQILPPIRPKSIPKLVQILPRPSQIPPKSSQILRKIEPKSIQKPSWSPFWTNALQKLDCERPQNGQEAPKSDQKTPQSAPTPSQMEPKTAQIHFPSIFFDLIFPYEICMDL